MSSRSRRSSARGRRTWALAADTAYIELLKSNTIKDPGSQFAVANYLQCAASVKASVR
jgi:hypothetical protein